MDSNYTIKQLTSRFIDANCYIIRNSDTTVIIDPCISCKELLKYNIDKVDGVLVTHAHADHILYLEEVVKKYQTKAYFVKQAVDKVFDDNKNLSNLLGNPLNIKEVNYELIKDGDLIKIGSLEFKCIYTPGHSDCSVCFKIGNDLFTGDTLFNLAIGRCDFYSGNLLKMSESLQKLYQMDDNLNIYPGHEDTSTLGFQKKHNSQMLELVKK